MNMNELTAKFETASADKEFLKMLFEQDTPEKIQAAFATKGIELTLDEVKEVITTVLSQAEQANGEALDEASLDQVSGGIAPIIGFGIAVALAGGGIAIGWKLAGKKC